MNLSLENVTTGKRKVRKGKRDGGTRVKKQQPPDDHDPSTSNVPEIQCDFCAVCQFLMGSY